MDSINMNNVYINEILDWLDKGGVNLLNKNCVNIAGFMAKASLMVKDADMKSLVLSDIDAFAAKVIDQMNKERRTF